MNKPEQEKYVVFLRPKDAMLHRNTCQSILYHSQHPDDKRYKWLNEIEKAIHFAKENRTKVWICQKCKPISQYRLELVIAECERMSKHKHKTKKFIQYYGKEYVDEHQRRKK